MGNLSTWLQALTLLLACVLVLIQGARWTQRTESKPEYSRRQIEQRLNQHGSDILGLRDRQDAFQIELQKIPHTFDTRYASREVNELQYTEIQRRLANIEGMLQKL